MQNFNPPPPPKKKKQQMHAYEAAAGANWGKMVHLPQSTTTGTSFGNFIYTTIVCNDTPLSWNISNFNS